MPHTTAKPKRPPPPEDHRVRTGALRREQTRRRLLSSAMAVFAEKGVDAPLIEDFIAAAGVARGTFYNHFRTTQDLLDAVTAELSNTLTGSIEKVVMRIPDPLERLTCGCLLYMHLGIDVPNWGGFVLRTGFRNEAVGPLTDVYLPRDLAQARRAGLVDYPTPRAARDLLVACIGQGVLSVHTGAAPRAHLREIMALALRGIGVPPERAAALSRMPLPEVQLPEGFGWDEPGAPG